MTTTPESPHIIRNRISQEMAFPVGYELLREHFGTSPHWPAARFSFTAHPTTFASEFARILRAQEPYCVLRVEHRTERHFSPYQPAQWHFTVYPVLRHLKSIARSALIGGFAELRNFIARAPSHSDYYNRSDAFFEPVAGTCVTAQLWPLPSDA